MKIQLQKKWLVIGFTLAFLGVIAAGFLGFYSLIVPKLVQLSTLSLLAIVIFAFAAGILSFFAPCSIAIFPSYMGYYLSETDQTNRTQALRYGLIASFGMILFYGILGIFVSYIGGLASVQTILKIGVPVMAVALGGVGLYFLAGKTINARLLASTGNKLIRKSDNTSRNLFLFGFGYSMSSIACIFPVFLLLIAYPFITGNVLLGITAFLAFALGKSVMMIAGTVLTSESKSQLLTSRNINFNYIKKGSGLLLILVAIYLTYYSLALYGIINPI
ncbi:MAG: cytochrome c biogenesis CcdA family protein [Candidatus Nanohaloarchaea archaeon]